MPSACSLGTLCSFSHIGNSPASFHHISTIRSQSLFQDAGVKDEVLVLSCIEDSLLVTSGLFVDSQPHSGEALGSPPLSSNRGQANSPYRALSIRPSKSRVGGFKTQHNIAVCIYITCCKKIQGMHEEKKLLLFFKIRRCPRLGLKRIYQCVGQLVMPPRLSRKDIVDCGLA
jgi:hypothetical protein